MHGCKAARRPVLGFAGLGWIGRQRMEALAQSGLAGIGAICDPSREAMDEAVKSATGAQCVADFEALLDMELDGLVIATPSALHAKQSIAALESGKAVFCQKPLGLDSAEVAGVVDAALRADRLLGLDMCYRRTQAMQSVRKQLESGAIGRVFAADLVFHNAYGPDKPWFYQPELSGGGCVTDLGVHLVDLLLWCLDFPRVEEVRSRLFAQGLPLRARRETVEDYAVAGIELETGVSARLACSWNLNAGRDAVISAVFHGTAGALAMENVDGSFYDFLVELRRGTSAEVLVSPPDDWGGRALAHWAGQLAQGSRFDTRACAFVQVADTIDRIYADAERKSLAHPETATRHGAGLARI